MSLSLEDILKGDDLALVEFEVPEWGGSIHLQPISIETMEKCIDGLSEDSSTSDKIRSMAEMTHYCACDSDGKQLFKTLKQVRDRSSSSIQRVGKKILDLNNEKDEAEKES